MEFSEEELISLALENNETAKNKIYDQYKYIVQIILKKYQRIAFNAGLDLNELEQEAYYAFSDAIKNYREDKNTKFATFLTLCINRRIKKIIKRALGEKAKIINNTFSLDYAHDEDGSTLQDVLSDNLKTDPLYNLEIKENYEELLTNIKKCLSQSEYEIFIFLRNEFDYQTIASITKKNAKQIDNAIQRVKNKIKDILNRD